MGLTKAIRDVLAERERQINEEGWTHEHDDRHALGVLSQAGSCYAEVAFGSRDRWPNGRWPFDWSWWKLSDNPRRNLVKAAALILAEIDKLDRCAERGAG